MKRIGIVSDSHGELDQLAGKLAAMGELDILLHLGDGSRDMATVLKDMPFEYWQIKGNCDILDDNPQTIIRQIGDVRLFATHGHLYAVKQSLLRLQLAAQENHADIICFGHTHTPLYSMYRGQLYVNPGSAGYAVLEVDEKNISGRLYQ